MQKENPVLVQHASPNHRNFAPPLILIHDGGGTVFGYFCLGDLKREVWAIYNPNYFTAQPWQGGMDQMAHHYISLIKDAGFTGEVFLGGWSLGGYLSILMANILARDLDSPFSVAGMVIVDSPYHMPSSKLPNSPRQVDLQPRPRLVEKSFDHATEMLDNWELPEWSSTMTIPLRLSVRGQAFVLDRDHVLHSPVSGPVEITKIEGYRHEYWRPHSVGGSPSSPPLSWNFIRDKAEDRGTVTRAIGPPPAVLIRGTCPVPSKGPADAEPLDVDLFRDAMLLGWDTNYPDFIKAVFDVDAHHFDIFDFAKVHAVTQKVKDGLELLDSLWPATETYAESFDATSVVGQS